MRIVCSYGRNNLSASSILKRKDVFTTVSNVRDLLLVGVKRSTVVRSGWNGTRFSTFLANPFHEYGLFRTVHRTNVERDRLDVRATLGHYRRFGTKPPEHEDDDDNARPDGPPPPPIDAPPKRTRLQSFAHQLRSPPNMITTARILSVPGISYLILADRYDLAFWGCGLAALSDYVDGYVARRYDHVTVLGTYLDPLADKITVNALACALVHQGLLPGWICALWIARDAGLMITTYFFVRSRTDAGSVVVDPGTTRFRVAPTFVSRVNTVLQFATIGTAMAVGLYDGAGTEYALGLCYATAGTTIASGLSYLGGKSMILSNNPRRGGESKPSSATKTVGESSRPVTKSEEKVVEEQPNSDNRK